MNDHKYQLGNENIGSLLFKYSTPAITAMMVHSAYNLVDTIFVGKGAGTLALAGLAVAFPVQMVSVALAQMIGIGSASIISRSLGAGEQRLAEKTAGLSFFASALVGFIWTIVGFIFLHPLLRLFGATPSVFPYARDYMTIIFMGAAVFSCSMSSNNIIRAEGNAQTSMNVVLIGGIANIILDPIFIFGLKMGIKGAALATIIAQFFSFLFIVNYFISEKSSLKIRREDLKPDFSLLWEIFKIGSSSLTRTIAGSIMAIVINNSLIAYGSELHLAIMGVINRTMMFLIMPLFGIVQGLQPIIGFNYGAGNISRVKSALSLGIKVSTVISSLGFILLFFFPAPVMSLFSNSQELITTSIPIVRLIVFPLPLIGFQIVGASFFQALGRAKPALLLSMARQLLFLVPLILILPGFMGFDGVIYSFPLSDLLSFSVTLLLVRNTVKVL